MLASGIHARDWAIELEDRLVLLELVHPSEPFEPLTTEMLAASAAIVASREIDAAP